MNINDVRDEISEKLKIAEDMGTVYEINETYTKLLEEEIKFKPIHVEAYCLLAMIVDSVDV